MPVTLNDRGMRNRIDLPAGITGKVFVDLNGNDNLVVLENAVRVDTLRITITGDNAEVRINPRRLGDLNIAVKNGGKVLIKRATSVERAYILADHGCTVSIGEDCMLSFNVQIRTTDAHGIYSVATGERLNAAQDVILGDHVWVGQGALISKGTIIGRNSVVGACSFVQGRDFPPSSILAGTPARIVKSGVVWDRREAEEVTLAGEKMDPEFQHWWNLAQQDALSSGE